jgi:acetyl-CoA synthetase
LSTAEIEAALVMYQGVAEAAVVAASDELTGQCNHLTVTHLTIAVNAFVSLKDDVKGTPQLNKELILQVRKAIGPFAAPKSIIIVEDLPKTRSGKIMRRILRKILAGEEDQLGDVSTLADPSIVPRIIEVVHAQKK